MKYFTKEIQTITSWNLTPEGEQVDQELQEILRKKIEVIEEIKLFACFLLCVIVFILFTFVSGLAWVFMDSEAGITPSMILLPTLLISFAPAAGIARWYKSRRVKQERDIIQRQITEFLSHHPELEDEIAVADSEPGGRIRGPGIEPWKIKTLLEMANY